MAITNSILIPNKIIYFNRSPSIQLLFFYDFFFHCCCILSPGSFISTLLNFLINIKRSISSGLSLIYSSKLSNIFDILLFLVLLFLFNLIVTSEGNTVVMITERDEQRIVHKFHSHWLSYLPNPSLVILFTQPLSYKQSFNRFEFRVFFLLD